MVARDADATPHLAGPFACFGRRWQIACDDPALARLLDELYAPMRLDSSPAGSSPAGTSAARPSSAGSSPARSSPAGPTVTYGLIAATGNRPGELFRDDELIARDPRPSRLLGRLMWAVNRQVIDGSDRDLLLHAAAAADVDGRVVLLPAPMESGKTTLVAGLLDRGLHYLSDEAVVVDPDLTVRGFAKPLSIDKGSWHVLEHHMPRLPDALAGYMDDQWQVAPQRFTTVVPSGALALIVFPTYRAEEATDLRRLAPVSALDLIRASTFGPEDQPLTADTMTRLAHVVAAVPCFELRSGHLAEACAVVLDSLEETSRAG